MQSGRFLRLLPAGAVLAVLLMLLAACDETIHEYPVPARSLVILQLNVDRSPMTMYRNVTYDNLWNRTVDDYPAATLAPVYPASEGHRLRLVVDVMHGRMPQSVSQVDWRQRVCRRVLHAPKDAPAPQDTIHLLLPQGDYYVLAWADYEPDDPDAGPYYQADTLTAVLADFDHYPMTSLDRACAAGQQQFLVDFDLTAEGFPSLRENARVPLQSRVVPVDLGRPVGLYRVYATDYLKFVDKGLYLDDVSIRCTYKMFVGAGFNVFTDEPNRFIATYSFLTAPMGEDTRASQEVFIFGDYLFTSPQRESNITADFTFFDRADGSVLGTIGNVEFPVRRNGVTTVRGQFLTGGDREGEGGVQIDERFDGEYVVHFEW